MFPEVATIAGCIWLQALAQPAVAALTPRQVSESSLQMPHVVESFQRRDAETSFDLGWAIADQTLFSGEWDSAKDLSSSLAFRCIDCRTWGALNATVTFPEGLGDVLNDLEDLNPINDINIEVAFNDVGAFFNLGVDASLAGTVKIPLFTSQSPVAVADLNFQVGLVFTVDLVLGATGDVNLEGGFSISIPTGSSYTIPVDPGKDPIAKFDGASAALLPMAVDVPANLTVALQFGVQAGVAFMAYSPFEAKALAGAYINAPELTFGEQYSSNQACMPASADININAGVYVDVGAEIGSSELLDINPTVATTLFSATATTCFGSGAAATATSTTLPSSCIASGDVTSVMTKTTTVAAPTQTLIACAVSAVNCPASLAQVVRVAAQIGTTSPATRCQAAVTATATSTQLKDNKIATTTATATTIMTSTSTAGQGSARGYVGDKQWIWPRMRVGSRQ